MGATVCFYFDESTVTDTEPGRAHEWDRLGENWNVDGLIMIDETRTAGRDWIEKFVPNSAYKQPWFRYKKIEEAVEEHAGPWVFVERKEKKPGHLCDKTSNLYKYEHRPDATYVFGGHYGHGLERMPLKGDWVHVTTGGPCGFAIQIAAMVMYDRTRKSISANEANQIRNKRERDMRQGLEQAAQVTKSALKILDKALG